MVTRRRKFRMVIMTAGLFGLIVLSAGELLLRTFLADRFDVVRDERNLAYRYDARLGWSPIPNSEIEFTGHRTISVRHNSRGFRERELRAPSKPRMVFLGDSFVWGYDVERHERFTELLQPELPDWEVVNIGVSGYGTDQAFLWLQEHLDFLQPRLVFLVFTYTDEPDNTRNVRYNEYFKPYYEVVDRQLVLRGTPVPESIHHFHQRHPWLLESYCARAAVRAYYTWTGPAAISVKSPTTAIVREMNAALASRGCTLALGFESRHADLSALAIEQDIPSVTLANDHVYQTHGRHWTPEGHALVSRKIIEFLDEHGLRDAPDGP